MNRMLDWLDQRNALQFLGVLYVARWICLAPVMVLTQLIIAGTESPADVAAFQDELGSMNAGILLVFLVVISPLFETLVECSLPYLVISRVRDYRQNRPKRCWGFITVSACIMALLHPLLSAILPSLITGAFLAYCYGHFAEKSAGRAILATTGFHGAINIVGWTMIMVS